MIYLTMNQTIRNDSRELVLKLICLDLNRLSAQSQAEIRHTAKLERGDEQDVDGIPALSISASVHPMQEMIEINAHQPQQ